MTPESKATMGTTAAAQQVTRTAPDGENQLLAWFQARQKVIGITVGVLALLALVIWYTIEAGHRKQAQAMEALDRARAAMESGNYPEASTGFQRVTQTFAGTDAAYEAALALNQVRLLSGQGKLASDELKKFAASNPPAPYNSAAHATLAMALEDLGKPAEAAAEYQKAADLATEDFRKVDALLNVARVLRTTGKEKEAIAVWQDIIKKYPKERSAVAEARVRLAEVTHGLE